MTWPLWLAVGLGTLLIGFPLLVVVACEWIIVYQWMRGET